MKGETTNQGAGLHLVDSHDNVIGGTSTLDRNVIANNANLVSTEMHPLGGIIIYGDLAISNLMIGNYIGLDAGGNALGNYNSGIMLAANNNTIGGTDPAQGNVVSATQTLAGFGGHGIWLKLHNCFACEAVFNNVIEGNLLGTDPTGRVARGNATAGIYVELGVGNQIGGAVAGAGNLVSGNGQDGIFITTSYAMITVSGPPEVKDEG